MIESLRAGHPANLCGDLDMLLSSSVQSVKEKTKCITSVSFQTRMKKLIFAAYLLLNKVKQVSPTFF